MAVAGEVVPDWVSLWWKLVRLSSLHPALLGMFAPVAQMEQWLSSLQCRGVECWRAEHGQCRAGTPGTAVSTTWARTAGGPKIPVRDGCEGCNQRRVGGLEGVELPGDISRQEASLEELQVEIGAPHVTRAALSVPVRLEGMGCVSEQKGCLWSCFPAFVKVCRAVTLM